MARYRYDKELQKLVEIPAHQGKNAAELARELGGIDKILFERIPDMARRLMQRDERRLFAPDPFKFVDESRVDTDEFIRWAWDGLKVSQFVVKGGILQ